jgi:hypothetical protein
MERGALDMVVVGSAIPGLAAIFLPLATTRGGGTL